MPQGSLYCIHFWGPPANLGFLSGWGIPWRTPKGPPLPAFSLGVAAAAATFILLPRHHPSRTQTARSAASQGQTLCSQQR